MFICKTKKKHNLERSHPIGFWANGNEITWLPRNRLVSWYGASPRKPTTITQSSSIFKRCDVVRIKKGVRQRGSCNKESMELTSAEIYPCIVLQNRWKFWKRECGNSKWWNPLHHAHVLRRILSDSEENSSCKWTTTLTPTGYLFLTRYRNYNRGNHTCADLPMLDRPHPLSMPAQTMGLTL